MRISTRSNVADRDGLAASRVAYFARALSLN
jgi:hypothetical protein